LKRLKIFVTVGNHASQFNRLFNEIDLIAAKNPQWDIFGQIGNSNYEPKNFEYKKFISEDELLKRMKNSNLIICHAGAGSIISALSMRKKIILVPRMKKFGEHTDDHQAELSKVLAKEKLCGVVYEVTGLKGAIRHIQKEKKPKRIKKEKKAIENEIELFIRQMETK
jgi:UDP-N-acetylglucosamine transferase subunit ALG13